MEFCFRRRCPRAVVLAVALLVQLGLMATAEGAQTGQMAPNFALKSVKGKNLRLSEFRGEVVMINFWATWCGPCRQEMPVLDELYRRYHPIGFALLGVNIDDHTGRASKMARRLGVSYPILFDAQKAVSRLYDVNAMPTTVMLDRDGRVRYVHRGYLPGFEKRYQAQIRELLKE
ncbi:MAG: TlpA family protein disulfide reductase [Acidiferrobacterales bacterium]